mgnify:FL=1|tara:strand:+ start:2728 stop:3849 length:1122 start_codon:yes stop_codon:yes gene_type:complete
MILRFYPKKDTTIYESDPERNTGLDSILEISKIAATGSAGAAATASFNSRILLDFDYTAISKSIIDLGYDPNLFDFGVKLYATEASEIPIDYSLEAFPISQSWNMGIGKKGTTPTTTEGCSWYYREGKQTPSTAWLTEAFAPPSTGSWSVNPGGGTWYTASMASQSFSYTTTDVDIDITSIIRQVQSGSIDFNGVIIKKTYAAETSLSKFTNLAFYSKETHTIYSPVIEARYDESNYLIATGSLPVLDTDEDYNIVCTNLRETYKEGSRPRLNFNPRYRYPALLYQTASLFLDAYRLPTGSQYAVYYAQSDDAVIPFSEYTYMASDSKGTFFRLHLDSFQPERYYRLLVKVPEEDGVSYQVRDNNFIFKVERN